MSNVVGVCCGKQHTSLVLYYDQYGSLSWLKEIKPIVCVTIWQTPTTFSDDGRLCSTLGATGSINSLPLQCPMVGGGIGREIQGTICMAVSTFTGMGRGMRTPLPHHSHTRSLPGDGHEGADEAQARQTRPRVNLRQDFRVSVWNILS